MVLKRPSNWRPSRLLLLLLFLYTSPATGFHLHLPFRSNTWWDVFIPQNHRISEYSLFLPHIINSPMFSVHLKYTSCSHDSDELACFLPRVCVYVLLLFIERPLLTLLNAPISLIIKNPSDESTSTASQSLSSSTSLLSSKFIQPKHQSLSLLWLIHVTERIWVCIICLFGWDIRIFFKLTSTGSTRSETR